MEPATSASEKDAAPAGRGARRRLLGVAGVLGAASLTYAVISLGTWPPLATVMSASMSPTIRTGDVVLLKRLDRMPRVGDVLAVSVPESARGRYGYPAEVVHRVVRVTAGGEIQTKGDARKEPDPFTVPRAAIDGRMIFKIPAAGTLLAFLTSSMGLLWLAGGGILFLVAPLIERRREQQQREQESIDGLREEMRAISTELVQLREDSRRDLRALAEELAVGRSHDHDLPAVPLNEVAGIDGCREERDEAGVVGAFESMDREEAPGAAGGVGAFESAFGDELGAVDAFESAVRDEPGAVGAFESAFGDEPGAVSALESAGREEQGAVGTVGAIESVLREEPGAAGAVGAFESAVREEAPGAVGAFESAVRDEPGAVGAFESAVGDEPGAMGAFESAVREEPGALGAVESAGREEVGAVGPLESVLREELGAEGAVDAFESAVREEPPEAEAPADERLATETHGEPPARRVSVRRSGGLVGSIRRGARVSRFGRYS